MDKQGRTPEKGNRRSDSVVRAVMYAIVASILGSVAVTSSSGQVSVAVCLRVAALFVFCSAYFGDEWLSRGDAILENCFYYEGIFVARTRGCDVC